MIFSHSIIVWFIGGTAVAITIMPNMTIANIANFAISSYHLYLSLEGRKKADSYRFPENLKFSALLFDIGFVLSGDEMKSSFFIPSA